MNEANAALTWFGPHLARLHPQLQALHRNGGLLEGDVRISIGRGLAGVLGRALARRLGIPVERAQCAFAVRIGHDHEAMTWERHFGDDRVMTSVFRPVGQYPDGHWLEDTGALRMKLAVDVVDGGWHWRVLGAHLRGLPLPRFLLPRTRASKCIDGDGRYRFVVEISQAPFGRLLCYEGVLRCEAPVQEHVV